MKIQNFKIDKYCKDLAPIAPAILLYGQDYGLISERSSLIINSFLNNVDEKQNSLNIIDLSNSSLLLYPESLKIEVSSISLLSRKKIVRIKDASDALLNIIDDYFVYSHPDCLIILLSDALSPRSKIRKFFEAHNDAVILPCYSDDKKGILSLINSSFKAEGVFVEEQGIQLFANYLGIDRLITKAEIEKAILYAGKEKKLNLNDITSFISDQASLGIDELYDYSLNGDLEEAYRVLNRIQKEGVPSIQIIRSFIRQMQSLYSIIHALSFSTNINSILDNFKPPIYFKRKENIKGHAQKWSLGKLNKALLLLESAEIFCKLPKSNPIIITKQAILSIGLISKK
jgi:DNA polymerase-3 subunit delta